VAVSGGLGAVAVGAFGVADVADARTDVAKGGRVAGAGIVVLFRLGLLARPEEIKESGQQRQAGACRQQREPANRRGSAHVETSRGITAPSSISGSRCPGCGCSLRRPLPGAESPARATRLISRRP